MGDIVMHPAVPAHELDVRKREVVTAIRQDLDNPAVQAAEGLMALLYGESHPYGRHVKGSIASVELMDAATLCDFHARHCAPSLATLVVVGDVDVEQVAACAHTVFSGWNTAPPREVVVAPPVASCERRTRVISMMNKSQADIAYGFTTIARSDPDYDTFWLMNNVLGQYALGGRLGDNIRERQGMAYYVSSTFDPDIVAGPLAIRAGVNAANVTRTVQAIDEEITSLVATGVTEKELAESRQYLIGSLPRALETNAGIAQFLQTVECFGLGLDYDIQWPARLGRVTRDGIADVARRYLDPSRAAVVIAGPYQA
jgi:zinc protease